MVKVKEFPHLSPDGTINVEAWLQHAAKQYSKTDMAIIRHASVLAKLAGEERPTLTGISCLEQGLSMAEILIDLQLDAETIAAALVYSSAHLAGLSSEDIRDHLGENVTKLVRGTIQMDAIRTMHSIEGKDHSHIENIRKMLLAMVEDMRVVLIKLAERTSIMRTLDVFDEKTCYGIAKETMEIYAPLANRLGIGQIKWELEDRSLRYIEPIAYKEIAGLLHETRIAREKYIQDFIDLLSAQLTANAVTHFEVNGRVKHIYSIYRKMLKKKVGFSQLYDLNAVRVLVDTIEDCYAALGAVHSTWQPISHEFDDYIATPKPNGYRSIHSAVVGPENKNIEIQIRTYQMHQESEHGVAAHWLYKEGKQQKAGYEAKIAWLRQVLSWQKELVKNEAASAEISQPVIMDDTVYVSTPAGAIIDLPKGSTPLDFAYHIHSEIGHRCRGAKVNGNMVPLTYQLNTGEQVEILTGKNPNPSRDWLNPHLGYLISSRAKAKVHHWFKQQDYDINFVDGQAAIEREIQRLALPNVDLEKVASKLHFKNPKDMLAALGCGDLRMAQVLGAIQVLIEISKKTTADTSNVAVPTKAPTKPRGTGISIAGVGNLLTHTAGCCKPLPGDDIVGFITQGQGVSIHRKDCRNILSLSDEKNARLFEVDWQTNTADAYPVDIAVQALDRAGLVRDITTLIANEKLNLVGMTTTTSKSENLAQINLTVEIPDLNTLSHLLDRIKQIPNVFEIRRVKDLS